MLFIRSAVFNLVFYLNLIVQMLFWTPLFFLLPRKKAWFVPKFWAASSLWLQRVITGARSEITGLENLPDGPCIIAPKHQSFWDTIAFLPNIPDALYILKRELVWIPFFGWYVAKMRMIPINRGSRTKALKQAVKSAHELMKDNRQLIIYPEGTRRPPGAEPAYKYGIVELYGQLGVPVVPVAHAAGLFWPRRKFLRHPGLIRARFLPPIEPGLPRDVFQERLVRETETACDEMLVEAATSPNPPPLPETARRRLKELGVMKQSSTSQTS
ncbi:1-acyl-sn-glycerol-3-phosphate acyltransferase [Nitratireductor sp. B36]|uniref:lysophospholipid acyltransferase family protein n=1 Tax=Nitratireductor sp. B36 TaxID=2762059 RepID=UPI001E573997|nr:1-acyl-sn-glycerol-3-phosphate acyltransferase [Nitratireductor sp. B36]MCC5780480.1 1-acyl-sn-glycerol-3-phosphate acyltransferase [Nitratireductor sp. B36]